MTYRLRFWYWHQEVVISGISADELVQSLYFPNSCEMKDFYRETELNDYDNSESHPIGVTIFDTDHITIEHLKKEDRDAIDDRFGEKNGRTELDYHFWILEEEA